MISISPSWQFSRAFKLLLLILGVGVLAEAEGLGNSGWVWCKAEKRIQVFPEVVAEGRVFEDVGVHYYVTKGKFVPMPAELIRVLRDGKREQDSEVRQMPLLELIESFVVHDTEMNVFYLILVYERGVVSWVGAGCALSTPPIYQPLSREAADKNSWRSEELVEYLEKLWKAADLRNE